MNTTEQNLNNADIENAEMDARAFLTEIKKEHLTGKEFLSLLGNSKISNNAYNEIMTNPKLTFQGLVALLNESNLSSDDFRRLLVAAKRRNAAKENALRKLGELTADSAPDVAASVPEPKTEAAEQMVSYSDLAPQARYENHPHTVKKSVQLDSADGFGKTHISVTKPQPNAETKDLYANVPADEPNKPIKTERSEEVPKAVNHYRTAEDFDENNSGNGNGGKIVLSLILAVLLAAFSVGMRYYNTGSIFPTEKAAETTVPETFEDIFARLSALSVKNAAITENKQYTVGGAENNALTLESSAVYGGRVCKIVDEKLYSIIAGDDAADYKVLSTAGELRGIFSDGEILCAVSDTEKKIDYNYDKITGKDDSGKEITEHISSSVTVPSVTLQLFDLASGSETPIYSYEQCGEYKALLKKDGGIILATNAAFNKDGNASAYDSYLPFYIANGEKKAVDFENFLIPSSAEYSNMTVLGGFDIKDENRNPLLNVCVGGADTAVYGSDSSLLLLKNESETATAVRYDRNGYILSSPVSASLDGNVRTLSADERGGLIRVFTYKTTENKTEGVLHILDKNLTVLSRVEALASGEVISGAAFDDKLAYIIGDAVYAIDTTVPAEPIMAQSIAKKPYLDSDYLWNDELRLRFEAYTDENGERNGLKLSMLKNDGTNVFTEADSLTLTAESGVSKNDEKLNNLNSYLYSDAETNKSALLVLPESGKIIVPICYFDGISEIEKFVLIGYDEASGFEKLGEITYYDKYLVGHSAVAADDKLFTFWGNMVAVAKMDDMSVINVFNLQ